MNIYFCTFLCDLLKGFSLGYMLVGLTDPSSHFEGFLAIPGAKDCVYTVAMSTEIRVVWKTNFKADLRFAWKSRVERGINSRSIQLNAQSAILLLVLRGIERFHVSLKATMVAAFVKISFTVCALLRSWFLGYNKRLLLEGALFATIIMSCRVSSRER